MKDNEPQEGVLSEMDRRILSLLAENIVALKEACRKSHSRGPGAARVCICGAGGGGSKACSALSVLRDLVRYGSLPEPTMQVLKTFL